MKNEYNTLYYHWYLKDVLDCQKRIDTALVPQILSRVKSTFGYFYGKNQ